jgi:hypothetical protein
MESCDLPGKNSCPFFSLAWGAFIDSMLAQGETAETILTDYP